MGRGGVGGYEVEVRVDVYKGDVCFFKDWNVIKDEEQDAFKGR